MNAAIVKKMQNDPEMANNPFAGLGMLLAPAIVDRAVETYVTSDGIADLVRGRKPSDASEPTQESGANPEIEYNNEWVGLDRFRVTTRKKSTGEEGPSFLFERRGFINWNLIKIELPDTLFDEA